MLCWQCRSRAIWRERIVCQTENVVRPSWARASIGALAATAWHLFSIGVPKTLLKRVCAHATNAKVVIRAWSTCGRRPYPGGKSRRRGGAELAALDAYELVLDFSTAR